MFHTFQSRLHQVANLLAMIAITGVTVALFSALLLLS